MNDEISEDPKEKVISYYREFAYFYESVFEKLKKQG